MELKNIIAYAYYGQRNYQVEIPLLLDNEIYNNLIENPAYYNRDFQDLSISGNPASIINSAFGGKQVFSSKIKFYFVITSYNHWADDDKVDFYDIINLCGLNFNIINASDWTPSAGKNIYNVAEQLISLSGEELQIGSYAGNRNVQWGAGGSIQEDGQTSVITGAYGRSFIPQMAHIQISSNRVDIYLSIWPEDILLNGYFNESYNTATINSGIHIRISMNNAHDKITRIQINDNAPGLVWSPRSFGVFVGDAKIPNASTTTEDMENPYGEDGTSGPGGGDGTLPYGPGGLDYLDPTEVPDVPDISSLAAGFITLYNPTQAALSSLGAFLWSNMFDIDTFKKLFVDPMDCIISLGIVPCLPNSGGGQNIKFGNVDTGVYSSTLGSQFAKVDCGWIDIQKYVGSFMDYSPYVKINLFLPYIGFVHLGSDDIMGGSINVKYNVDVLSGDCVAFIYHSSKGVLYSYSGNCRANIAITSQNYAAALKNYYESIVGIIPNTVSGAAKGGAAGAAAGAFGGAVSAASDIVLNSKPTFQRSGNIGGSAGLMGVQTPFIIIERPNISVPNQVQHYAGQTSNITANLGECSGMTIVDYVHLHGIAATSEEIAEIESLLKAGVIL